jgi:hypothetical protein
MRTLRLKHRVMALHAAMFWSNEKLDEAETNGDLPWRAGEAKPVGLQ